MEKIKILFFIENLYEGGAEKVLCNLVNQMDQSKFEITVQSVWPCDSGKYLKPGIRYKSIFHRTGRVNQFRYRAEAELGIIYPLHIKDDYDIEIAYLECGPTKVIAGSTNKKAKKVAWVHVDFSIAHDLDFVKRTKKYYQQYDKVVCVSQCCLESFEAYYGKEIDTVVIHNVVNIDEIIQKSKEELPEGKKRRFTICSVGRLVHQKNYIRLVNTVIRLLREGYQFDTWIIGEGDQRGELEKLIKINNVGDSVRLFGFVDNPYPFMRESDLLVCSSSYEGFSTFITEGIVLSKPILTTECSGMHELLDGYEAGMITDNSDEAFYHGLKQCITMPYNGIEDIGKSVYNRIDENEKFFESLLR